MKQINLRIGNIELRKTLYRHIPLEIVQWEEGVCWVIASYHPKKGGYYDLRFVGDRPFDERVNINDFMDLAKFGHKFLENMRNDLELPTD